MAFDAKSAAAEIVRLVGGKENINSVAHCMTRLRFVVKDLKKADQEALKKVPGVLGVIYAGGQLMVVLGKNLLPVYETVVKDFDLLEGAAVNENLDAPAEKKPLTLKSAGVEIPAANYVGGLGGRSISKADIEGIYTELLNGSAKVGEANFVNLRRDICGA